MKRYFCLILVLMLLLCGCGKTAPDSTPIDTPTAPAAEEENVAGAEIRIADDPVFDYANYDWTALLLADALTAGTPIGDAALAAVEVKVEEVTNSTLTVTVTAPYIAGDLWDWYETNSPDNAALEEKILSLLSGTKTTGTFLLTYRVGADGRPVVDYTAPYGAAVSCGLTDFYHKLQAAAVSELEEDLHG